MTKYINIFQVRDLLNSYGFWYTLWFFGVSGKSLWHIFVAWRMIKFDQTKFTTH